MISKLQLSLNVNIVLVLYYIYIYIYIYIIIIILICLLWQFVECPVTRNASELFGEMRECIFSSNTTCKRKIYLCTIENLSRLCQREKYGMGRKRFVSARTSYYPNGLASFQLTRIATSGDISWSINRPKCSICNRTIARNHQTVSCKLCNLLCHIKCGGISPAQYKDLQSGNTVMNWSCSECIETLKYFPFANVSNLKDKLNTSDMPHNSHNTSRSSNESIIDPLETMI